MKLYNIYDSLNSMHNLQKSNNIKNLNKLPTHLSHFGLVHKYYWLRVKIKQTQEYLRVTMKALSIHNEISYPKN